MKIDVTNLYNALGSPEARRAYEERLLQQVGEKLEWLHKRVQHHTANHSFFDGVPRDHEGYALAVEARDSSYYYVEFNQEEWRDIVVILWALLGYYQNPGDNGPIDLETIASAVAAYRARWQEEDGCALRDENGSRQRSGAPGRPSGRHLVENEFERRMAGNLCEASLSKEAEALAEWYRREHPDAPRLLPTSIENQIRNQHRAWRSNDPQK
jgi:hypothetical protein